MTILSLTWVFGLQPLDDGLLAADLLGLDLVLHLGAVHVLDLAAVGLGPRLHLVGELCLLVVDHLPGDGAQLSVLADLRQACDPWL